MPHSRVKIFSEDISSHAVKGKPRSLYSVISTNTSVGRSRQQSARRKCCQGCSTSKRKCDMLRPQCSRCISRGYDCVYNQPDPSRSRTGSVSSFQSQPTSSCVSDNEGDSEYSSNVAPMPAQRPAMFRPLFDDMWMEPQSSDHDQTANSAQAIDSGSYSSFQFPFSTAPSHTTTYTTPTGTGGSDLPSKPNHFDGCSCAQCTHVDIALAFVPEMVNWHNGEDPPTVAELVTYSEFDETKPIRYADIVFQTTSSSMNFWSIYQSYTFLPSIRIKNHTSSFVL